MTDMKKLKPYNKYMPVQYDYISELPDGWQLLPNIAIFQERIERGYVDEEELLSVTIGRGVMKQTDLDKKDSSTLDKSKYLLVYPGDLVYSMRFRQGASGYSLYKGIVSPACTVLRNNRNIEIDPRYFYYVFRTGFYKNYIERFAYGIADGQIPLRYTHFKRMYSIVPPLETQNAIVDYLDRKTTQIQDFIRKKERLIELLEEKKYFSISEVITKGLNSAELTEAKNEWIGEIPKHWTFIPLGYLLSYISYGFTNPMPTTDDGPYMLTANDIGDGEIHFDTCRKTSNKDFNKYLSVKSIPINGDILVTKDGTLGRTSIFNGKMTCINQSVALLRVNDRKASNIFIEYVLRSKCYLDKMIFDAEGTTIKHIYITKLSKMKIALPPINEQFVINDRVQEIRKESSKVVSGIYTEIAKIKEYQESLITNVVTGKLKVPE